MALVPQKRPRSLKKRVIPLLISDLQGGGLDAHGSHASLKEKIAKLEKRAAEPPNGLKAIGKAIVVFKYEQARRRTSCCRHFPG